MPWPNSLLCRPNTPPGRCLAGPPARYRTAEALQAIVDLDLDLLAAIEPPRGYDAIDTQ
jgi:hypothetical protein